MADVLWRGQVAAVRETAPAASPQRPLDSAVTAEWRKLSSLSEIEPAWRALAGRALEPNVFYDPAFALPAAAAFGQDAGGRPDLV